MQNTAAHTCYPAHATSRVQVHIQLKQQHWQINFKALTNARSIYPSVPWMADACEVLLPTSTALSSDSAATIDSKLDLATRVVGACSCCSTKKCKAAKLCHRVQCFSGSFVCKLFKNWVSCMTQCVLGQHAVAHAWNLSRS